jgi:hypothetical protein
MTDLKAEIAEGAVAKDGIDANVMRGHKAGRLSMSCSALRSQLKARSFR